MIHPGLIGAVLYAKDLPRLVEFYSPVASLQVQTIDENFAVLGQQPSELVIVRINSAAERGGAVNPSTANGDFDGIKVCDGYDPEGNIFQLRAFS